MIITDFYRAVLAAASVLMLTETTVKCVNQILMEPSFFQDIVTRKCYATVSPATYARSVLLELVIGHRYMTVLYFRLISACEMGNVINY